MTRLNISANVNKCSRSDLFYLYSSASKDFIAENINEIFDGKTVGFMAEYGKAVGIGYNLTTALAVDLNGVTIYGGGSIEAGFTIGSSASFGGFVYDGTRDGVGGFGGGITIMSGATPVFGIQNELLFSSGNLGQYTAYARGVELTALSANAGYLHPIYDFSFK